MGPGLSVAVVVLLLKSIWPSNMYMLRAACIFPLFRYQYTLLCVYGPAFRSVDQKCQRRLTKVKNRLAISIEMWATVCPINIRVCTSASSVLHFRFLCLCTRRQGSNFRSSGEGLSPPEKDLKGEGQQLFNAPEESFPSSRSIATFSAINLIIIITCILIQFNLNLCQEK